MSKDSGKKRQVVYLHGLSSSGQSTTAQRLRRTLSKYEVISPDIATVSYTHLRAHET